MTSQDLFSLANHNIIITGASSGIGRECAVSCSKRGANVFLIARNNERLAETLSMMENYTNHQIIVFDVVDFDEIEGIIRFIVTVHGKISGFVHCAGSELILPTISMKATYYQEMYNVNVVSAFEFAKQIAKKKYCSDNGCSMVFIASVMGTLGQVAHVSYCATKGALIAGSKALALEYAPKGIRINTVSPAQIENTAMTDNMLAKMSDKNKMDILSMHPLGLGSTQDVASACIYLLSDAARWVTGTNLIVDGGYSTR